MREHSQALARDGESEGGGGERRSWCGSLRMRSAPSLPYFPGKHGTDWCPCHPLLHADVNYSGGAAELLHSCRRMTSPPAPRSQPASQSSMNLSAELERLTWAKLSWTPALPFTPSFPFSLFPTWNLQFTIFLSFFCFQFICFSIFPAPLLHFIYFYSPSFLPLPP